MFIHLQCNLCRDRPRDRRFSVSVDVSSPLLQSIVDKFPHILHTVVIALSCHLTLGGYIDDKSLRTTPLPVLYPDLVYAPLYTTYNLFRCADRSAECRSRELENDIARTSPTHLISSSSALTDEAFEFFSPSTLIEESVKPLPHSFGRASWHLDLRR